MNQIQTESQTMMTTCDGGGNACVPSWNDHPRGLADALAPVGDELAHHGHETKLSLDRNWEEVVGYARTR